MLVPVFRRDVGPPENVDDAAVYWLARRGLGTATPHDDAAFRQWLEDPAAATAFTVAERAMSTADDLSATSEILRMREAALVKAPAQSPRSVLWKPLATAAAVIAVAVVLVGYGFALGLGDLSSRPLTGSESQQAPSPGSRRFATAVGERRDVTLDDGSVITLNTHSAVEVAYSARRRDVRLLQGQALFQVAHHGKGRPFIVTAGTQTVTATGTAFDVRLDGEDMRVALLQGRVVVAPIARAGLRQIIPALGRQALSPGEQLVAPAEGPVRVSVADVANLTSWRHGLIVFRDERLATVIAEINRYSTTQFVVENPQIANLKISGVFNVASDDNFLAALTAYYPLTARRRSANLTEIAWSAADQARQ